MPRTGKNRVSNVDHILIPSAVMKQVVETTLNLLMPRVKDQIISDMANSGLHLDDKTAYYSLSQVRDYLQLVFGEGGADLIVNVLRDTLEKTGQFDRNI